MWIGISAGLFIVTLIALAGLALFLIKQRRKNNILSNGEIKSFFEGSGTSSVESTTDGTDGVGYDVKHDVKWKDITIGKILQ